MNGIGGYVRHCERKPYYEPRSMNDAWLRHTVLPSGCVVTWRIEPPTFQCMPILKFEEFPENDA